MVADKVMTNGNSGEELAKTLHESGMKKIDLLLKATEIDLKKITDSVLIKRIGIDWTVRALDIDEQTEIADRTITTRRVNGKVVRRNDNNKQNALFIYTASVDPNLKDDRLFEKMGVDRLSPEKLIAKLLLPGEIVALVNKIMTLSGYEDSLIEAMQAAENL